MQTKEPRACDMISEISAIGKKLENLADDQLGALDCVKQSTDKLLASLADAEHRLSEARTNLKKVLKERLRELETLRECLEAKADVVARIGTARTWPSCIPASILADYKECCLVRNFSPKASVMLARRCLQGMIRHFFTVDSGTLFEEAGEIHSQVDHGTWVLIDEVRKMGNVGAHPMQGCELATVEAGDAGKAIRLLERLFKEWYVDRHAREQESNRSAQVTVRRNHCEERPRPGKPLDTGHHERLF